MTQAQKWDEEVDLVIIGSGFAGITAGIEALLAGSSIAVLEKMPTAGGNSVIDSGELSVVNSPQQRRRKVKDSANLLAEDILTNGQYLNDPLKVRYIAEHAYDVYEWTKSLGVRWTEGVTKAGGHSVPRIVVTYSGSGKEIYSKLYEYFERLGGRIRLRSYVQTIVRDSEGKVQGVIYRENYEFPNPNSGTVKRIRAKKAVILCYGGFAADQAFRMQYRPELDSRIETTNQPGATGEMWQEAKRIGCLILQTGWIQCTPWNNPKEKGQGVGWIFSEYAAAYYGLWVNSEGNRFVDEGANRKIRTDAIFKEHKKGNKVFCIASAHCVENLENLRPGYMKDVLDKKLIIRADTLEELAEKLGINFKQLEVEIKQMNNAIKKGVDKKFGRSMNNLKELNDGPWYGSEMTPKVHHCLGGVMTDPQGRALDAKTQLPIPGLFAAGEAAGGVHGACRLGACAILDCLVMGRLVGKVASNN